VSISPHRRLTLLGDVPHTWQVDSGYTEYRGVAWYRRTFDVPGAWLHSLVRIEFEAVFHTATIWVNGQPAGEHTRKGYTAFTLDITRFLRWGKINTVAVRVDNAFNDHMLPRGRSSDWAHDGGIYRPVQLLVTPKTFVERVDIEAIPNFANNEGNLTITAYAQNASSKRWSGRASFQVFDEETGSVVLTNSEPSNLFIEAGTVQTVPFHAVQPMQSSGISTIPIFTGLSSRSQTNTNHMHSRRRSECGNWKSRTANFN
jgi:beta-galactosidase